MNSQYDDTNEEAWQQAMSERLGRLRAAPIDASRLENALASKLSQRAAPPRTPLHARWLAPLRAIAASFVLLGGIAAIVLLLSTGGPALASAAQMAQVHRDIVSGKIPVMQVDSIDAANRMLNQQTPGAPALPQMPREHVMACCMKSVHDKKMACLLLKDKEAGIPITLAVANAADMQLPPAEVITRAGISYRVQTVGELHMVMTERQGRWLCLIGQLPAERLMDVAGKVRF
ncbi:MAG TPA: hypothetical protein VFC78_24890 [Tepidisphaeraceae bacterium]|nr:hypothetical protein [Tepidisphaeraceae bacterium]